jgi:hypothetical protein
MRLVPIAGAAAVFATLLACSSGTNETAPDETGDAEAPVAAAPVIDEDADDAVQAMCDVLTEATQFSFRVESAYDDPAGHDQPVELMATARVVIRRPDGLFVERRSDDKGHRVFRFDGRSRVCGLLDVEKNMYASGTAMPTNEETLDALHELFNVTIPLADLAVDDPYDALNTDVRTGSYVGEHAVRGTPCRHVAYSNDTLDWQVWIASKGEPVPRKVSISYKLEPGAPRYTAYLDDWNLNDATPAAEFEFRPPEGARRVALLPRAQETTEGGTR